MNAQSHKRSRISAAQTRCLDMQEKQHIMEMEILQLKKNNLVEEHQKRMEVLEAELQHWTSTKKRTANTQEEPPKRITRQRK